MYLKLLFFLSIVSFQFTKAANFISDQGFYLISDIVLRVSSDAKDSFAEREDKIVSARSQFAAANKNGKRVLAYIQAEITKDVMIPVILEYSWSVYFLNEDAKKRIVSVLQRGGKYEFSKIDFNAEDHDKIIDLFYKTLDSTWAHDFKPTILGYYKKFQSLVKDPQRIIDESDLTEAAQEKLQRTLLDVRKQVFNLRQIVAQAFHQGLTFPQIDLFYHKNSPGKILLDYAAEAEDLKATRLSREQSLHIRALYDDPRARQRSYNEQIQKQIRNVKISRERQTERLQALEVMSDIKAWKKFLSGKMPEEMHAFFQENPEKILRDFLNYQRALEHAKLDAAINYFATETPVKSKPKSKAKKKTVKAGASQQEKEEVVEAEERTVDLPTAEPQISLRKRILREMEGQPLPDMLYRIQRWKLTSNGRDVKDFYDFKKDGEKIQSYANLSDEEIEYQRARHMLWILLYWLRSQTFVDTYCFHTYFDGRLSRGIYARMDHNGKCYDGIIHVGQDEENKFYYHVTFDKNESSSDFLSLIMRNGDDKEYRGIDQESKDFELVSQGPKRKNKRVMRALHEAFDIVDANTLKFTVYEPDGKPFVHFTLFSCN